MAWDSSKFSQLESTVMGYVTGNRRPIDVPFIRFRYDPGVELRCIREFSHLAERLKTQGTSVELISLSEWLIAMLKELGCFEEPFLQKEKDQRPEIAEDLGRELTKRISTRLGEQLKGREISSCAILLRVGSVFPFVHISSVLSSVEGVVRCTLVVAYPGSRDGEMLDYRGETIRSYYRGEVIE
jgi:hypothetical protein